MREAKRRRRISGILYSAHALLVVMKWLGMEEIEVKRIHVKRIRVKRKLK